MYDLPNPPGNRGQRSGHLVQMSRMWARADELATNRGKAGRKQRGSGVNHVQTAGGSRTLSPSKAGHRASPSTWTRPNHYQCENTARFLSKRGRGFMYCQRRMKPAYRCHSERARSGQLARIALATEPPLNYRRRVTQNKRSLPPIRLASNDRGDCRVMGDRGEDVGGRAQIFPSSRRIAGLCNENPGIFGPLCQLRSRSIRNPTASW